LSPTKLDGSHSNLSAYQFAGNTTFSFSATCNMNANLYISVIFLPTSGG